MNIRGKITWVGISFVVLVVVAVGLLSVWRVHLHGQHADGNSVIVYTCPMHPEVIEDKPGKCPICGMDLIPLKRSKEKAGVPSAATPPAPSAAPAVTPPPAPKGKERRR